MPSQEYTAIVYPADLVDGGARIGPETILRLKKFDRIYLENQFALLYVVLAAGFTPERDKFPRQKETLAAMMKAWLVENSRFESDRIICTNRGDTWNSIRETLEMIRIIKCNSLPTNVVVISAKGHVYPRMWMTWQILRPKGWLLDFVTEPAGKYDLVHELLGTVKYFPMALWYRSRI